ncbi:MAG: succinyl-diaminopimelate desuccinylase [Alphaproteobacteria bacterium]|nr:succinyl-diaminopimelate desuccinylase [Rickettsiales bacterium]
MSASNLNVVDILRNLVAFKSITPADDGCLDYIAKILTDRSFTIIKKEIKGATCLYARLGSKGKNLCLSGHIDVVPPGSLSFWDSDPFLMIEKNGFLIGRGVCDMKGGISAFMSAIDLALTANPNLCDKNSLSILFTSDEEKAGVTSCEKFLKELHSDGEKIDHCLIGEPTSYNKFGDSVKVGRRGSCTVEVKVTGLGGHVAYPRLCNNPLRVLIDCLSAIQKYRWDSGTEDFEESNLEVVGISSSDNISNLISGYAVAQLNLRFNVLHTLESVQATISEFFYKKIKHPFVCELDFKGGNKPFVSSGTFLLANVRDAIKKVTSLDSDQSTAGGCSDGSYISVYCKDMVEFGVINSTAHKANESVKKEDIHDLVKIYFNVINSVLGQ